MLDFDSTGGSTCSEISTSRIRHDIAYLKLIEYVYKKWIYIETCTLFMFDFKNNKEIKIGFWDKSNFSNNELYELILVRQESNVLCIGTLNYL